MAAGSVLTAADQHRRDHQHHERRGDDQEHLYPARHRYS
jgi:hypothetical protein